MQHIVDSLSRAPPLCPTALCDLLPIIDIIVTSMSATTEHTTDKAASAEVKDLTNLENKDPIVQSDLQGATSASSTSDVSDQKAVENTSLDPTTGTDESKDVQGKETTDDESDSDDSDVPHFEGGTPRGRIQGPVAGSKPKPRPK
ncbi:unnamed protein product [Cyclocybe aegerita]|uniref:Uncharacterized protein n=1 Tax=Cyclocybe aegerita TaxID=1973307 RepID=A0A8S0WSV3_CYCAE|nr:unnamed protein product [Cyclocybe aegerita]